MKFRKTFCPHCGQSIKGTFAGVYFTPARHRVFKAVKDNAGITLERLGHILYPEKTNLVVIRTTITTINNLLAATDYHIDGPGYGKTESGYRLTTDGDIMVVRLKSSKTAGLNLSKSGERKGSKVLSV